MMDTKTQYEITTDDEFKKMIPPLAEQERAGLEESILHDGCLDPLIVWKGKGILIDGHNRKNICDQYGIGYQTRELAFDSREDAADWIDAHHLGRRNLTPDQISLIRGRRYNRRKAKHGGNRRSKAQNGTLIKSTAEQIAQEAGVSKNTIKRDGQYAEAVSRLGIEDEVTSKEINTPRGAVIEAAREISDHPAPQQIADAKEKLTKPHIANNSGDNEWYTSKKYIETARQVMGDIDLDPASCQVANEVIQAKKFYTKQDNGLSQNWKGRIWMNPPYAQPAVHQFCEKLVHHVKNGDVPHAIVLVNNATETKWGQLLLLHASAICFPSSRIKFWHPDKVSAPLQGQMIVYFGNQVESFFRAFQGIGAICYGK